MTYKLFIDDERFPPDDGGSWVISRSFDEVKTAFESLGWPNFISFDHDLGDNVPTGKDIANWLVEQDLDFNMMPEDFSFYVHSQNSVGAVNIQKLLENYLKVKKSEE